MEAQPKPLTAEDAGGAEDAGKAQTGGAFSSQNRRKLRRLSGLALAEVAEEAEVFWGYCRELSNHLAGDEKGWANVTTPKNLCFLCYLCVSRSLSVSVLLLFVQGLPIDPL